MAETEEISFVGAAGARLTGHLHHAVGEPKGAVLLAHCFTCSSDLHTSTRLATGLADAGYAALRFDFTGLGESEGDFETTTLASDIGDLSRAAVALIERNIGPCILLGHSLGGAAALLAAHRLKSVERVVVIAAPSSATHIRHLLGDQIGTIEQVGRAVVDIGGRPFPISRAFLQDLGEHDVLDAVASLDRPLLVVVPGADTVVDPAEGHAIYDAAAEPKAIEIIDGADHLLTDVDHAADALRRILAWLS